MLARPDVRSDDRVAWRNLEDPAGAVHAAVGPMLSACGRRFSHKGQHALHALAAPTDKPVNADCCRAEHKRRRVCTCLRPLLPLVNQRGHAQCQRCRRPLREPL